MTPLYVDTSRGALVVSPVSAQRCLPPVLTIGDTLALSLAFLQRNPQPLSTGTPIYTYVDMSAAGVTFSVGAQSPGPSAGVFTLTWLGSTTPALPFNCSSYDVFTALNALDSISHNGGVSVQGNIGGPFTVQFLAPAVRQSFTADGTNLYPPSTIAAAINIAGSTTAAARQTITLAQSQVVTISAWTPQPAPAVGIQAISGNLIQRVTIPAGTYGGVFTLSYNGTATTAIPFNAQFDLVASLLNALPGVTGATVVSGQNYWDVSIPAAAFPLVGSAAGLIVPLSLTGSLPLTSPQLIMLLCGEESTSVPFAIRSTAGGASQTLYAGSIVLQAPVSSTLAPMITILPRPDIDGITGTSNPLDGVPTAGNAVTVGTIFVVTLSIGGFLQGQQWQLIANPGASNGTTIQRPQDYNASTNNVGWIRTA